jgi:hypothetical protein
MARNNHWYNTNETRGYPLDESATLTSDQGERLPANIVSDINLRYPEILGPFAFLASVGISTNLVSVTLQSALNLTGDPGLNPLAVFTLPRDEVIEGRPYPLEAQAPGVGGWIVFGSGIQEEFTGRFSGPAQALLAPRAARAYRDFPVASLGKLANLEALSGIIRLQGVDPVEIVKDSREIDGIERDVIVIRLFQAGNTTVDGKEVNVFDQFTGPCGSRPESETCGDPAPIEFVNSVAPDCDGNLTVEIRGCAEIGRVLDQCGIVVDCGLGLSEACLPKRLPEEDGTLPNEYPDLCFFSESPAESESEVSESVLPGISESPLVLGELPFRDCFPLSGISPGWVTQDGVFGFVLDNSPQLNSISCSDSNDGASYATLDENNRNLTVWDGFDDSALNRKVTTDLKLSLGPTGAQHNGGLVLNFRPDLSLLGAFEYFLAQIDWDRQVFELVRFNGNAFVPTTSFAFLPGLKMDTWYRITATIVPATATNVAITVKLDSLEDSSLSVVLGPITTSLYLPDTGLMGIHANRSLTRFSWFEIKETP